MGKYYITVEETYSKIYEVEADNLQQAITKVDECTDCTYSPIVEPDYVSRTCTEGWL